MSNNSPQISEKLKSELSSPQSVEALKKATPEQLERIKQLIGVKTSRNRVTFADLKIRTKSKQIIPFEPNYIQRQYLNKLCPRWREGVFALKGVRDIILKGRQQGFSTLIQAIFFCETLNGENTQTVVLAHDLESTERIFQMVQIFYDNLPDHKKPFAKYASKRMFYWPSINSYYSVGTAGAKTYGRGGTINNVHFSEVAFAECADLVASALLQAVPVDGNVFEESTANGVGNYFSDEWELSRNGESAFRRHFCPWFETSEYRLATGAEFVCTDDEQKKAEQFGLDDEQLNWYRTKRKELKEKVAQEYPHTEEEAFLSSGHPYFDRDKLTEILGMCKDAIQIESPTPTSRLGKAWTKLKVWKVPVAGRGYIISADTAEGLPGKKGDESDFDSASVWDAETYEQVAHLHGKWDTHEYGLILAELGVWYNTALIGVERNNHGHAVINSILHAANYPPMKPGSFGGLYFHEEYDAHGKFSARKPGWPTTPKTKYFALDGLASTLIEGDSIINCKETIAEMMRYVKLPGGQAGGEAGSHDDRVMDAAIGDVLLKLGLWKKTRNPAADAVEFFKLMGATK